jgi:DegV family protein with EDD domain
MAQIAIVTDSAANLPAELVTRYAIRVVPIRLNWDGDSFRDGVDITPSQLYQELRAHPDHLPSSSSPPVGDFLEVYRELLDTADAVVSIHLAAKLSATHATARQAQSLLGDERVVVVDSGNAMMGCGFVALAAAQAADAGASLPDVLATAQRVKESVFVYGVLDSLTYVQRSGRVPFLAALAGSLLHIHPLLLVKDGEARLLEIQHTKPRAVRRLLAIVAEKTAGQPIHAAVMHADAPQEAEALREQMASQCHCLELLSTEISPVVGSYAGPGLIAVAFYPETE